VTDDDGRTFGELSGTEQTTIENYPLTITEVKKFENEDEIRELFIRLNLGIPINSGERLNAIKSNYKNAGADYTGKTVSESRTITLVSDTVKIAANKDSVTRSKPFSVTVTGKPATYYWVWVKGCTQMGGGADDQPPMIASAQPGIVDPN
jgi:hypothetical protein